MNEDRKIYAIYPKSDIYLEIFVFHTNFRPQTGQCDLNGMSGDETVEYEVEYNETVEYADGAMGPQAEEMVVFVLSDERENHKGLYLDHFSIVYAIRISLHYNYHECS